MTILTCKAYTAEALPTGEIRLVIKEPKADAIQDKLSMSEIAELLQKSVKSIDRLSRRRRNPLPIHRGHGRPFGLRYEVNQWLNASVSAPMRDFILGGGCINP